MEMMRFWQSHRKALPIVIYQMGKVGSTALYASLNKRVPVYQVHSLSRERIAQTRQQLINRGIGVPDHLRQSQDFLDKHMSEELPLKVISPIREPLPRNISAFFQMLSIYILIHPEVRAGLGIPDSILKLAKLPVPFEWKCLLVEIFTKKSIDQKLDFLISYFKTRFPHRLPLDWFDSELKPTLGIDVFASPFKLSDGYEVYQERNTELLVYQSELSNERKTEIISAFLGIRVPFLSGKHSTADKLYAKTYHRFKESIILEKDILDLYHHSKFAKHFYPS